MLIAVMTVSNTQSLETYANEEINKDTIEIKDKNNVSYMISDTEQKEKNVDTIKPELISVEVDKKEVKPGDKVTVIIEVVDNQSGIDSIEVEMGGENSNQLALPELVYNEESKKYELTIEIDGTMSNGIYNIFYIAVHDKAEYSGM